MEDNKQLLFPHGGYRKLKSFQLAQLCFDITVRFVELYIPKNSRTTDHYYDIILGIERTGGLRNE